MSAIFYIGDAIEVMGKLPEKSVDLVISSPPFLALRSYLPSDHPDKALEGGSQATPGEYVDWLLDVVEACARVLAPHGSLVFELGDTYSGSGGAGGDYGEDGLREGQPKFRALHPDTDGRHRNSDPDRRELRYNRSGVGGRGWPLAKSLSLIPESFRFAMVYGHNPHTGRTTEPWRLRNVIRWVRPNPPVGALGDKFRPATSELMVFCKAKDRYFDLDSVRGEFPEAPHGGYPNSVKRAPVGLDSNSWKTRIHPAGAPPLDWWNIPLLEGEEPTRYGPGEKSNTHRRNAKGVDKRDNTIPSGQRADANWSTLPISDDAHPLGSPPLDWWNIPPGGYPGAHYAVWPPELLIKPIKAMCPAFVCTSCGLVLASDYDQTGSNGSESLRGMRTRDSAQVGAVAGGREEHAVLLGVMPESSHGTESVHDQGMDPRTEGIHPDPGTASPDGDQGRLRHAASAGDGGISRPISGTDRSGSPQERGEKRQPDREPGIVDESGSRPASEARSGTPRLSSLRRVDSNASECPSCGGVLRLGRVLDPFGGSGTTAAVATGHGRDCWLIDLDARNYDLALDRVGPLVLELGAL